MASNQKSKIVAKRKPKFERVSDPAAVMLTERDLDVLFALLRYRFLSSDQITALIQDGSPDQLKRRLQLLFHAGYVDRPPAQKKYFSKERQLPFVYAVARAGAKALMEHERYAHLRLDWAHKNKSVTDPTIKHTLAIADSMIGFETQTGEEFLSQASLLGAGEDRKELKWKATVPGNDGPEKLGVIPDQFFGLRAADGTKRFFFVEADRGKMPIVRTGPRQTSLLQKVQSYMASRLEKTPQERFGIHAFRVIFVVPSEERRRNLLKAVLGLTQGKGSNLFLYATYDGLKAGNPMAYEFLTGAGATIRLDTED